MRTNTSVHKLFLLSLCFLAGSLCPSFAQIRVIGNEDMVNEIANLDPVKNLGTDHLEIIYESTVLDPEYRNKSRNLKTGYFILQVSNDHTLFRDYEDFKMDSVLSLLNFRVTIGRFNNLNDSIGANPVKKGTLHQDKRQEIWEEHAFAMGTYFYSEPLSDAAIPWTLYPEDTLSVADYKCHAATASFRGREWKAYFTEEIPVSEGPWKLRGLPGVILSADSQDGEIKYRAVVIRKGGNGMFFEDENKLNYLSLLNWHKLIARHRWDFFSSVGDMVKDLPKEQRTKLHTLFWNPEEKVLPEDFLRLFRVND